MDTGRKNKRITLIWKHSLIPLSGYESHMMMIAIKQLVAMLSHIFKGIFLQIENETKGWVYYL